MKKNEILQMNTAGYSVDLDKAVDDYADMVYRIAVSYVKNTTEAQDIFQNTFLKLTRYKDTIESEEHLRAWLIRVAVNCAKSFVTSTWNKTTEGLDLERINEPVFEMEEHSELYEMILALDDKYKMPLYLYYYEGYSVKEIAEMLGEKENTIKSNLSRGRKKLKEDMERKM
ncbi:MAG: RNA polymerase sigma factor [Eubacteriales bacterium]|nr:RNA polymerase sigma factor [Eubacteriales bacterium]